jgi:hypothetical protein
MLMKSPQHAKQGLHHMGFVLRWLRMLCDFFGTGIGLSIWPLAALLATHSR